MGIQFPLGRLSRRSFAARGFCLTRLLALAMVVAIGANLAAQQPNNAQQGNFQNAAPIPGLPIGFGVGNTGNASQGGAANADFDSLIDLIVSTVATETWAENGGGQAEIRPFPTGVLVDTAGVLRMKSPDAVTSSLAEKRRAALPRAALAPGQASKPSALRYVSLPRLERAIARRHKAGEKLDPAMLTLAGLERVNYIFAYPESGDLVLAGPAGNWQADAAGHILSQTSGEPVVRLDDLLTLLRRGPQAAESHFGCSINPRQESLAKTQAFLAVSSQKPLEPGQRKQWLGDLRDTVGRQDIEVFGIDPASRVAAVLVEADYHMKLIGMGLAEGVDGVESYLDSIHLRPGETPPAMSVLRWWFALNYKTIGRSEANDAFQLIGPGVRVLSENELLAEQGQRVHTGLSEPLNRQFAESFTARFGELAKKYPVYGELRNIFDLAMTVALIQQEGLAERVGWKPTVFARLRLPQGNVPREVETVINHRVINRRTILAGVSGGVMVAPQDVLKTAHAVGSATTVIEGAKPAPANLAAEAWWWDAKDK